jgi:hypothetical protein
MIIFPLTDNFTQFPAHLYFEYAIGTKQEQNTGGKTDASPKHVCAIAD